MARITRNANELTAPRWAGDFISPERMIPGGARLVSGAFPDNIVPSGTVVGRTIAERDASAPFGPAADTDDEIFLTVFEVDTDINPDVELYRHNGVVYENYLPVFSTLSAALKTVLRSIYRCSIGRD